MVALRIAGWLAAVSAACLAALILAGTPGYKPIRDAGSAGEATGVFLFLFASACLTAIIVALAVWVIRRKTGKTGPYVAPLVAGGLMAITLSALSWIARAILS
jgi:hypothetical protein